MKKAAVYILIGLSVLTIILTVTIYIGPRLGWTVYPVTSSSMEPSYKKCSIIISGPVEPNEIEVGDVILFYPIYWEENIMAHRVAEIQTSPALRFITQGDANLAIDPAPVIPETVVGKVRWNIPGLAGFINFVKSTAGFIFMIVVPGVIILLAYVISLVRVVGHTGENKGKK